MKAIKNILLHTCCGPCALYPIQELKKLDFHITLFFYNPNIWPRDEYTQRLNELKKYLKEHTDIKMIDGRYEPTEWQKKISGWENEPERGRRCELCYAMRLEKTALLAINNNCDFFGTTLSISPHKNSEYINKIGTSIAQIKKINFFVCDWKKNDGFKNACALSRQENFYRQNYCGCIYSQRPQKS
jgi:predicted adenine nucleotide alpha hydrolase (AANH) superfamily ATPase